MKAVSDPLDEIMNGSWQQLADDLHQKGMDIIKGKTPPMTHHNGNDVTSPNDSQVNYTPDPNLPVKLKNHDQGQTYYPPFPGELVTIEDHSDTHGQKVKAVLEAAEELDKKLDLFYDKPECWGATYLIFHKAVAELRGEGE